MVTNYPHPVASGTGIRTTVDEARGEAVGVIDKVRQMFCGLHGHDNLLQFEQDRMFLKCVSCGRETPGWALDEARPTVTARGDAARQVAARPRLVDVRRIA